MTTARRSNRRVRIIPYRPTSGSARDLARASGVLRVPMNRQTRFIGRPGDVLVNWGYGYSIPLENRWDRATWVNDVGAVNRASNKLHTFRAFSAANVPTVAWTTDPARARGWWTSGSDVVVRSILTGSEGRGISVVTQNDAIGDVEHSTLAAWPAAPLYTRYFKKRREFRVHVWGNDILDLQEKRKRRGADANAMIRSHNNGWVFAREGVVVPECVSLAAVAAVRALGLDFGAVDVGYNEHYNIAAVFEVNTAPGIEGTTLARYVNKIKELQGG